MPPPFHGLDEAGLLHELVARESVRDCLYRFTRGLDRRDAQMLTDVHWPDALIEFGGFSGSPTEFADTVFGLFASGGVGTTVHSIANILIRVDGDVALSECYAQAYHRITSVAGLVHEAILNGRYHDRFERREGEWRISRRTLIFDHFRIHPDSGDWDTGAMGVQAGSARLAELNAEGWDEFAQALRSET